MPKATKRRAAGAFNHPVTSAGRGDTKEPNALLMEPILILSGHTVREFRRRYHLSANELARRLLHPLAKHPDTLVSFSRSYVKRIEGGTLRPSAKFIKAFFVLRNEYEKKPPPAQMRTITAILHKPLPEDVTELEIIAPAVRCVCGKWFVPSSPQQKIHSTPSCRRLARRLADQKKKRTRKK